ncbi:MAG: trans-sulfuration enzyme family protein [Longimicrobiales bacterium]
MSTEQAPAGRAGSGTAAVHAGAPHPRAGEPVVQPLVASSTFFSDPVADAEVVYTRYGNNPNHLAVAAKLARLEGTESALVLASGMAAISMSLLAFAGAGDHIVATSELYGGTRTLLSRELPRLGIDTTFVETRRTWRAAIEARTRILYVEALSNPLLRLPDFPALAALARDRGIPLMVDATFVTPINLRPVELGADIVIHSGTKFLGGHSDLIAGSVAGPAAAVEEITMRMRSFGAALDPHATWLLERGLKTLELRVLRQNANALELAERLSTHAAVRTVYYPGLRSHPDHARAAELMRGFGGVLALVVEGGDEVALQFLRRLRLARVAPSLGGVETLVSMPRFTSHAALSVDERRALGIEPGLVRVSLGIEDVDDLWRDVSFALERHG